MSSVRGRAFDHLSDERIAGSVDDLLAAHRASLDGAESVVVLPSAHYPYHPSTGLVTNPTVVARVARSLATLVAPDRLVVAVPGSPWCDAARVSEFLGYPEELASTPAEVVHLDTDDGRRSRGNGTRTPSVHPLLSEATVVNVPTLRRCPTLGLVAGMGNVAWALTADPDPASVAAAVDAVDPAVTLLDGTYVFGGAPSKPAFLLASDDAVALDRVCASILGIDVGGVPYLSTPAGGAAASLDGVRIESLRADVRGNATVIASPDPSDVMVAGYRLYSRLSGDLLPPQFLDDGGADE